MIIFKKNIYHKKSREKTLSQLGLARLTATRNEIKIKKKEKEKA